MTPLGDRETRPTTSAALVAAALVAATIGVRVPTDIYRDSVRDFASASRDVVLVVFASGLLLFAVLALLLLALPVRLRRPGGMLLIALATFVWVRSSFFPGPSLNLDGTRVTADLSTGVPGIVLPLLAAVAMAWLAARRLPVARTFLAAVLAGSLAQSIVVSATVWRVRHPAAASPATIASVLQWSRRGNVLILVLDTLQSDVFEDALAEEPGLREQLDGFRYYRYASSNSPTTYLSLPTIYSGRVYDPNQSAWTFFDQAVREQSVLNRLATAGYSASSISSMGVCPSGARCVRTLDLAGHARAGAVGDAALLLDLGIYRALPDGLRRVVLERDQGVLASLVRRGRTDAVRAEAVALERLASESTVSDSPPTAKIIHSVVTHPPLVLEADCSVAPRRRYDREGVQLQARCALKRVGALFERLRAARVYDVSDIVVMADHGYRNFESRFARSGDGTFRRLIGAFNPFVLVKPAHAHGRLATSDAPIELADVPNALCDASACNPTQGLSRLEAVDAARPRVAFWYDWKNEYWKLPQIPGLIRYTIRGDLRYGESWTRAAEAYEPGTVIDFRRGQGPVRHRGFGWGRRQETHIWMADAFASVWLRAPFAATHGQQLMLVAASSDAGDPAARRVRVEVNGIVVGELTCDGTVRRFASRRLQIPRRILAASQDVTIGFRLASGGDAEENAPQEPCFALQTLELRPAP